MKTKTVERQRGDLGERAATRYLRRRFYRILERNWFFYRKEIDIIARRGRSLVICEVKTRTRTFGESSPYGSPSTAVDAAKQHNLSVAARAYVRKLDWRGNVRMDVIEVYLLPPDGRGRSGIERIVHIPNAFYA